MASTIIAKISRADLKVLDPVRPVSITDVKDVASYNWIKGQDPAIVVPGLPPRWTPPKGSRKLQQDVGTFVIAMNAARQPDSPLEPLFRSLLHMHPSFDLASIDVITDRNNIRKLLQFINPGRSRHKPEPFTINIEVTKDTAILARTEAAVSEVILPGQFRGFGHQFEKVYTASELSDSEGHYRVISYMFSGMKFLVRHETDAYVKTASIGNKGSDSLSGLMDKLRLASKASDSPKTIAGSELRVEEGGYVVPREATLEIKTRVSHRILAMDEVAPQLWISQTPKLVRAYHRGGNFSAPWVEDVSKSIQSWEKANQSDLSRLAWLIKHVVALVKDHGGKATVRFDPEEDQLVIRKTADLARMLPEGLYAKWDLCKEE